MIFFTEDLVFSLNELDILLECCGYLDVKGLCFALSLHLLIWEIVIETHFGTYIP